MINSACFINHRDMLVDNLKNTVVCFIERLLSQNPADLWLCTAALFTLPEEQIKWVGGIFFGQKNEKSILSFEYSSLTN